MANSAVQIFEVGPRDGLQNESKTLSLAQKIQFIQGLIAAGIREIELGAFVRPDKVPQMADTDILYEKIRQGELNLKSAHAWALVPNRKGLERALKAGVSHIAVFTAATESFARKNIGMSIEQSLSEFKGIVSEARAARDARGKKIKIQVRGYVSTAFGCPFEGKVPPKNALKVVGKLFDLGVDQVSIGDTIGMGTPKDVDLIMKPALKSWGSKKVAIHLHDTRGTALANALRAYELGTRIFDSSAGGLGGCPFAPGATGNLATEDLLFMFNGMGVKHGIDLEKVCKASLAVSAVMNRPPSSRYLQAFASSYKC
jgi:hydroxymethylglutaryl-CoA lyase